MGPQAMEGALKVSPGDTLKAGYDFTIPGSHAADTVEFAAGRVTFQAQCVSGGGGGTLTVTLPTSSTSVAQNDSNWYPSGDQSSSLVYQGSLTVPNLCSGGQLSLSNGGTFTAYLGASVTTLQVHARWHYSADGSSGSWSGTTSFTPGGLL